MKITSIKQITDVNPNVSAYEIVNNKLYAKNKTIYVSFHPTLKEKLCTQIANSLGGYAKTKQIVALNLKSKFINDFRLKRIKLTNGQWLYTEQSNRNEELKSIRKMIVNKH